MIAMKPRGSLCAALVLLTVTAASAQDFRVTTQIHDVSSPAAARQARRAPVGRSAALFHAGKVYDCLDASNQMTIFEPAQERFVILDRSRRLATTLSFEEIHAALDLAAQRAEQELDTRQGSTNRAEINSANLLRFHLHPRFREEYDASRRRLELSSPLLLYTVQCEPAGSADIVKTYLQFADWAARLNYVVNPQVQLPGPRLELNKALLRHNVLPAVVEREWRQAGGVHLKAEHKFSWKLDPHDRDMIHDWEKLLHAPDIKRVPLSKLLESKPTQSVPAKR